MLLFRDYKPLTFFGGLGLIFMILGLIPGIGVVIEYAQTGLVPRLPSALLAAVLEVVGILLILVGFVLSSISKRFQEIESKLDLIAMDRAEAARERRGGSDLGDRSRVADRSLEGAKGRPTYTLRSDAELVFPVS